MFTNRYPRNNCTSQLDVNNDNNNTNDDMSNKNKKKNTINLYYATGSVTFPKRIKRNVFKPLSP